MKVTTVGVDLAKAVFAVHGAHGRGEVVFRKSLKRTHYDPSGRTPRRVTGLRV